jgi:hypothetical protein
LNGPVTFQSASRLNHQRVEIVGWLARLWLPCHTQYTDHGFAVYIHSRLCIQLKACHGAIGLPHLLLKFVGQKVGKLFDSEKKAEIYRLLSFYGADEGIVNNEFYCLQ